MIFYIIKQISNDGSTIKSNNFIFLFFVKNIKNIIILDGMLYSKLKQILKIFILNKIKVKILTCIVKQYFDYHLNSM
jgi:hypothetical protein